MGIRDAFLDMSSACIFDIPTKLVADLHASVGFETSTYVFVRDDNPTQCLTGFKPTWLPKVSHADEETFLFGYDEEGILRWTGP